MKCGSRVSRVDRTFVECIKTKRGGVLSSLCLKTKKYQSNGKYLASQNLISEKKILYKVNRNYRVKCLGKGAILRPFDS